MKLLEPDKISLGFCWMMLPNLNVRNNFAAESFLTSVYFILWTTNSDRMLLFTGGEIYIDIPSTEQQLSFPFWIFALSMMMFDILQL